MTDSIRAIAEEYAQTLANRSDTFHAENLEAKRTAVEAFTCRSTWDQPFHEFEWAVVDDALANCEPSFTGDGNLFLPSEGECHVHALDDAIERTIELVGISDHPEDRHDALIDLHRIATALRAAADRVDREAEIMAKAQREREASHEPRGASQSLRVEGS